MSSPSSAAIDTERLTLRCPRLEDFEEQLAMWADPVVVRHITGKPATREEGWARLLRYVGHWHLLGYGFWVVREKHTGRFVGDVGFGHFHRDMEPPLGDAKEVGGVLAAWAHGQGYATEAMRAALDWAEARFGAERMVCIINPDNADSLRVAGKCGFREFSRGVYKGAPTLLLERLPRGAAGPG